MVLDEGACVSVFPFLSEGDAIAKMRALVQEAKVTFEIDDTGMERLERTSYEFGDEEGRRYQVFVEGSLC